MQLSFSIQIKHEAYSFLILCSHISMERGQESFVLLISWLIKMSECPFLSVYTTNVIANNVSLKQLNCFLAAGGLRERRDGGVPGGQTRQALLHRSQLSTPGWTHGHRRNHWVSSRCLHAGKGLGRWAAGGLRLSFCVCVCLVSSVH